METRMSFAVDTEHARRQKSGFVVNTEHSQGQKRGFVVDTEHSRRQKVALQTIQSTPGGKKSAL